MGALTLPPDMSPEGSLSRYMRSVRDFPMLERDEELDLARRYRDKGDRQAAERLVTSHLRLVTKIAMGYRGYGLPVGELIGEGNVGMMQAVRKFDPEKGFRLSTYAMWWIRAAIQEYILHSWSLVKMGTTAAQKKLFFNLRRLKGEMKAFEEGDLAPEQVAAIAERLDVPETEVVSMNRRMTGPDQSLNAPLRQDGDGEWLDWLTGDDDDQELTLAGDQELTSRRSLLTHALKRLGERERQIIVARRLEDRPSTLQDLSDRFGISRERVRQIEAKAFDKLRRSVRNAVIETALRN